MPTIQYEPTNEQIQVMVNRARSDYIWKAALKNEGTQRLDMWYQSHVGETVTQGAFQMLRRTTEDAIRREVSYRDSALTYKELLTKYSSIYNSIWISNQFEEIDDNIAISTNDQRIIIETYQVVEKAYMLQEEEARETVKLMTAAGFLTLAIPFLIYASYKSFKIHKAEQQT